VRFRFKSNKLRRLYEDSAYRAGLDVALVKAFRMRMQQIGSARDERDFRALKSLHYEKLKADRAGQHAMRLNDQWRLVLEVEEGDAGKIIVVVAIKDYH